MLLAVHRSRRPWDIIVRPLGAGVMQATLIDDVNHSVLGMLFAVCRRLRGAHVKEWLLPAGVVQATPGANVNHAVLSMVLTVHPLGAAFEVEGGALVA